MLFTKPLSPPTMRDPSSFTLNLQLKALGPNFFVRTGQSNRTLRCFGENARRFGFMLFRNVDT